MLIPPTTQSVKARAPKHPHGLHTTSLHSTHHGHGGGKRARTIFTTEQLGKYYFIFLTNIEKLTYFLIHFLDIFKFLKYFF